MSREALLAAVYAAPDDDEPRRVYADWLLQHGDPRGEFIQLQLTPDKTKEQRDRERKLFVVWSDDWLNELGAHPYEAVFERGFVAVARPREKTLRAAPGWATVHTLISAAPRDDVAMPALRTLQNLDDTAIAEIARLRNPLPVRELWWTRSFGDHPIPFAPWESISVLPELRRLLVQRGRYQHHIPPLTSEWLWKARWAKLDELVVNSLLRNTALWFEATRGTAIRRIEIRDGTDEGWLDDWRVAITRDDRKLHVEAFAPPYTNPVLGFDELRRGIATLPARSIASARFVVRSSLRWTPDLAGVFATQDVKPELVYV